MKAALRLNLVEPIDELAPFVPDADSATPAGKWQISRYSDDQITRQPKRDYHPRVCFVQEMTMNDGPSVQELSRYAYLSFN